MSFDSVMSEHFPGAIEQSAFVKRTLELLGPQGFDADNTIACVAVCRDELCTGMKLNVRDVYGEAFNMSSLAGMVFCGKTSFMAAQAHSPIVDGKERYVYFVMTHIAFGTDGQIGLVARDGRDSDSSACGALCALLAELESGKVDFRRDPDDHEYSLLREAILRRLEWSSKPGLIDLTKLAEIDALESLERMIELTQTRKADHAIFAGVQIHAPDGKTLVWTGNSYVVVDGQRKELSL